MTYKDGATYSGEWEDGKWHGSGTETSAEHTYKGQWKHGMCHGMGTMTFADGDVYDGQYEGNAMHGNGRYIFGKKGGSDMPEGWEWVQCGDVYTGTFVEGCFDGGGLEDSPR